MQFNKEMKMLTFEKLCNKHEPYKEAGDVLHKYPYGYFGGTRVEISGKSKGEINRVYFLPKCKDVSHNIIWTIYKYPDKGIEIYIHNFTKKVSYIIP